jgi:hypothetical protein
MNSHVPKWTPILGIEILMEFQIFKKVFHWIKELFIPLENS